MRSKKPLLCLLALVLMLLLTAACFGCTEEDEPDASARVDYSSIDPSEYIRLDAYTDLTVTLADADASKGEAIWEVVMSRAEVLSYPEEQVAYYAEQSRATYRYYAKQNGWKYEEALEKLGVNEEQILEEARRMVKGDLVYRYIVADAKIVLTETEKNALLDRYAEKYVEQYGYTVDYVKENMTDLIYDSMLYDKTMEYLILQNSFTADTASP